MVNLGLFTGNKSTKPVKVTFRLPYYTQWGQSLLVCGSEPLLGSWNVKKGVLLSPFHQGDELIWRGSVGVPSGFRCEYTYYVVDDNRNILRWEAGKKRKFSLPQGIQDGESVELHDLWQNGSDSLPFRSTFKDVIFRRSWHLNIDRSLGVIEAKPELEVLVHFKICCPHIEEGTSVYVTGSSTKLGQWKVHDGLKVSYAGESIWQADCVIMKTDFPIRYKCSKYNKAGTILLETGPNREISIDSSTSESKYIFLSDGMLREIPW